MDEIKTKAPPRLPALPALQRTPLLADAAAFALLGGGGYLAPVRRARARNFVNYKALAICFRLSYDAPCA